VETSILQVATQTRLGPRDVIAEAKRQGLSDRDYRDEIRRQIIEGKLVQLRVRGRVHVTEQDARAAYAKWRLEVAELTVDLRIIVLRLAAGAAPATLAARMALGQQIVNRARGGEDFCKLVAQYSPAPYPRPACGSRGGVPWATLFPELARAARTLERGQVAEPFLFRDPTGNQAVLVVQRSPEQHVTPYEMVEPQMHERAVAEATERQRKLWLRELRGSVAIDIRL
jgi:peptidyl-prolyl cis-trans isomerase SurA